VIARDIGSAGGIRHRRTATFPLENSNMHRFRSGIVGILLTGFLAGCGETSVDEGPKGFTPTDTKPMEGMLKDMQDGMKTKNYTKRPVPEPEKSKEPAKKK
jgi:hypothetical protein